MNVSILLMCRRKSKPLTNEDEGLKVLKVLSAAH